MTGTIAKLTVASGGCQILVIDDEGDSVSYHEVDKVRIEHASGFAIWLYKAGVPVGRLYVDNVDVIPLHR